MSFSDLLYPDNPKRRQKIYQLIGQVQANTKIIWGSTNMLIKFYNEKAIGDWQKLSLPTITPLMPKDDIPDTMTMKNMTTQLSDKLDEVAKVLKPLNEEEANKLDPELFDNIKKLDTEDTMSFIETLNKVKNSIIVVVDTAIQVVAAVAIKYAVKGLTKLITKIVVGGLIELFAGGVGVAVDVLIAAIFGAIERAELEKTLDNLEPEAEKFNKGAFDFNTKVSAIAIALKLDKFKAKCRKCKAKLPVDAKFCPQCGTPTGGAPTSGVTMYFSMKKVEDEGDDIIDKGHIITTILTKIYDEVPADKKEQEDDKKEDKGNYDDGGNAVDAGNKEGGADKVTEDIASEEKANEENDDDYGGSGNKPKAATKNEPKIDFGLKVDSFTYNEQTKRYTVSLLNVKVVKTDPSKNTAIIEISAENVVNKDKSDSAVDGNVIDAVLDKNEAIETADQ